MPAAAKKVLCDLLAAKLTLPVVTIISQHLELARGTALLDPYVLGVDIELTSFHYTTRHTLVFFLSERQHIVVFHLNICGRHINLLDSLKDDRTGISNYRLSIFLFLGVTLVPFL